MIIHKPTKRTFENRKEAKIGMGGTANYNKALKNGEFTFITVHGMDDIVFFK